jgi:hypothetical protein
MKCEKASEITAYLQGEGSEEERAMLRRHFEQCEACARELSQFERAFGALGKIETIDPSPDFQNRVQQAFLKAHPQFARPTPRFRLVPAMAVAAGILIAVSALVLLVRIQSDSDDKLAIIGPAPIREADPQLGTLPKSDLPAKIDAKAWGEALAVDRRLVDSLRFDGNAAAQKWLAAQQDADGSWKGGTANETLELTGLAVLALGPTEQYALATRKGLAFLRSRQRDSGAIGGGSPESHAIATLALLEAAIRTKDAATIRAAEKGVALIAQQNQDGPWGKGAVAAWQYHVLRLAVAAGDRALTPALVRGYEALSALEQPGPADGCALFWTTPVPDRAKNYSWILDRSPLPGTEPANYPKNDLWLAYFGTMLLRPQGGDAWTKWWSPLQAKLLKTQGPDGSWPEGFAAGRGQIYVTALAAIILEVPQRLPALPE